MTILRMDAENAVIETLLEVILRYGLSTGHAKAFLGQRSDYWNGANTPSTKIRRQTPGAHSFFYLKYFIG